jgi:Family of unknown function (DUF6084)
VPELVFDCVGAEADRYAVVPSMTLRLRISETSGARVEAIALRCQVRIEPQLRRYSTAEAEGMHDLFGDTDRWSETLKPMQFTTVSTMVPGFSGATTHELPLPFPYDLEVAATKYFSALEDGMIPLLLLYSGTVFAMRDGRMSVQQLSWSKESSFPLPVSTWRETIDLHYPDSAWFRVRRETMESLRRFKSRNALPTWDATLDALLARVDQPRSS